MTQKISPTLDQAKSALSDVQNMVTSLLAQRTGLQTKRQEIFEERESLLLQPLSKAEVLQGVCDVIDLRSATYEAKLKKMDLFDLIAHPTERGYGEITKYRRHDFPLAICDLEQIEGKPAPYACDTKRGEKHPPLKDSGLHLPILPRHGEFEANWLYFFFGDLLKQKLCGLLSNGEEGVLQKHGQPSAQSLKERRKEIADLSQDLQAIDQEIQALEQDIESLTAPVIRSAKALNENQGAAS